MSSMPVLRETERFEARNRRLSSDRRSSTRSTSLPEKGDRAINRRRFPPSESYLCRFLSVSSCFSGFPPESVRASWKQAPGRLHVTPNELEAEGDRELQGSNPNGGPSCSKLHLPVLRGALTDSGLAGGSLVGPFSLGSPLMGPFW